MFYLFLKRENQLTPNKQGSKIPRSDGLFYVLKSVFISHIYLIAFLIDVFMFKLNTILFRKI